MSGHQEHYLSRLERVEGKALDRALLLYNNRAVREFVMDALPAPRPERFAIALDEGNNSPHVVLTREGRFVTCLGRGMTLGGREVIPFRRLRDYEARRDAMNPSLQALEAKGPDCFNSMHERFMSAEELLSRETFLEEARWQPLILEMLGFQMNAMSSELFKLDKHLPALSMRKLGKIPQDSLKLYWQEVCASGSTAQMMALDVPMLRRWMPELTKTPWLSWQAVRHLRTQAAFGGLWAVGKIGPSLIPAYKTMLGEHQSPLEMLNAYASLTVIALRHRKSTAEIRKLLTSHSKRTGDTQRGPRKLICTVLLTVLKNPDAARTYATQVGRMCAVAFGRRAAPHSPHHFKSSTDVPQDLILPALALAGGPFLGDGRGLRHSLESFASGLTLLAGANPEDLYFPQALIDDLGLKLATRADILNHLNLQARFRGKPHTVRVDQKPRRNVSCLCNSGRKYKKCCGLIAQAA